MLAAPTFQHFEKQLADSSCYLIVDGEQPPDCTAKTILLSSPHLPTFKEFRNLPGHTMRYMPLWSEIEIEACRVS